MLWNRETRAYFRQVDCVHSERSDEWEVDTILVHPTILLTDRGECRNLPGTALDIAKLHVGLLAGLGAGGIGTTTVYGSYHDGLLSLFGLVIKWAQPSPSCADNDAPT